MPILYNVSENDLFLDLESWYYSSGCNLIFADVRFRMRCGAPQMRSLSKHRVDRCRRTPHRVRLGKAPPCKISKKSSTYVSRHDGYKGPSSNDLTTRQRLRDYIGTHDEHRIYIALYIYMHDRPHEFTTNTSNSPRVLPCWCPFSQLAIFCRWQTCTACDMRTRLRLKFIGGTNIKIPTKKKS